MTPKVPDYGHRYADKKLVALLRRLRLSYLQASISLQQKIDDYMEQFEKEDAMMRALYDSGELSHEDFLKWRQKAVMETQQWKDMREQLTNDLMNQDRIATDIINDALPEVYAENHNYGTYEAEVGSGIDTTYTMYDKNTVARLLRENQDLLPNYHKPDLDISKDKLWNRQHIQSAVLQGILTGEPMGDIAKRFQSVVGMDERAAMRNARTAVTGAENAGRIDSYLRAETMGIKMKQVWMATLDGRTRDSHAAIDGEKIDVGRKFSNGCRYPGDPEGAPAEIYNCRCTLVAEVEGSNAYDPSLRPSEYLEDRGLTYEQWKQIHGERYYNQLFKDYEESSNSSNEFVYLTKGKNNAEITDNISDYFLPENTRNKIDEIRNLKTYNDFRSYFSDHYGIQLDTGLESLKSTKADDEIEAVMEQCQKIVTAVDAYRETFGQDALTSLKKIYLYDQDLDVHAAYFFNRIGEDDPLAGEIHFKGWKNDGRDIFHELAHAFQDSQKGEGEDAVTFSERIIKLLEAEDMKAYFGANKEDYAAEQFADAFGFAFFTGEKDDLEFLYKIEEIIKKKKRR